MEPTLEKSGAASMLEALNLIKNFEDLREKKSQIDRIPVPYHFFIQRLRSMVSGVWVKFKFCCIFEILFLITEAPIKFSKKKYVH